MTTYPSPRLSLHSPEGTTDLGWVCVLSDEPRNFTFSSHHLLYLEPPFSYSLAIPQEEGLICLFPIVPSNSAWHTQVLIQQLLNELKKERICMGRKHAI